MKLILFTLLSIFLINSGFCADGDSKVGEFQQRWAVIKYQLADDQRRTAFEELAESAETATAEQPDNTELLIWQGIILSSLAGESGGLRALKLVKQAREKLELALTQDETALSGSAYTSLGALHYQIPGWPISFGSKKKAREFLEQGLTINPDGIDSNFFYGDFLLSQGEIDRARQRLEHALAAKNRPQRPIADAGRREEIKALLAKIGNNN